ncbi:MAG: hypothetical protein RL616_2054 [Verrucomicrobiota bacterium]|jgi:CheY-like chemotaxis protein
MNGATRHILLVEDNADHAELLRRNLETFPAPLKVHQVDDGEAALDYIFGRKDFSDRTQFPAPDLILLDWRLPRLDGVEVLRAVKQHPATERLPVVVLTTSDMERDMDTAIRLRADKFLTKPADGAMLLRLLTELGFNHNHSASPTAARTSATA